MIGYAGTSLDKEAIGASFSRAAAGYDRWAEAQRRIARRLAELCPAPERVRAVLELGSGTGLLTRHLRRLYPDAELIGVDLAPGMVDACRRQWAGDPRATFVVADAEAYLPPRKMDLVCSSCAAQWFADPTAALEQMAAGLGPGGRLALAVPVEGTAAELAESYRQAMGSVMPGLDFGSGERWLERVGRVGIGLAHQSVETVRLAFGDPWQVLQTFKGIGATFGGQGWSRPLGRSQLKRLVAEYQDRFSARQAGVPLTYRVWYMVSQPLDGYRLAAAADGNSK